MKAYVEPKFEAFLWGRHVPMLTELPGSEAGRHSHKHWLGKGYEKVLKLSGFGFSGGL